MAPHVNWQSNIDMLCYLYEVHGSHSLTPFACNVIMSREYFKNLDFPIWIKVYRILSTRKSIKIIFNKVCTCILIGFICAYRFLQSVLKLLVFQGFTKQKQMCYLWCSYNVRYANMVCGIRRGISQNYHYLRGPYLFMELHIYFFFISGAPQIFLDLAPRFDFRTSIQIWRSHKWFQLQPQKINPIQLPFCYNCIEIHSLLHKLSKNPKSIPDYLLWYDTMLNNFKIDRKSVV